MRDTKYPEHQRMKMLTADSQAIGSFLDWLLNEKRVPSGRFQRFEDDAIGIHSPVKLAIYRPSLVGDRTLVEWNHGGIEQLLADYFHIDLKKIQREKQEMYESLKPKPDSLSRREETVG